MRTRPALRVLLLLCAAALAPAIVGGFEKGEILCEEAVAHMDECCPDFMAAAYNCDNFVGCGTSSPPDITPSLSECIRNLTCDEVVANGWCETTVIPAGTCP